MDNNHPSTPLHQHRPSTAHDNNSDRPASPESNKLNLASPSQPLATTSLPQWQGQEQESPYEQAAPTYVQEEAWPVAGPSTQAWESALTQPLASSSRCPTPPAPPSLDLPPKQSLLTSEPLNRSASSASPMFQQPLPSLPPASKTTLGKRRHRSHSLPLSVPDHTAKRHRNRHHIPTPSDAWCFRFKASRKEASKLERAEVAAQALRKELERIRPRSATSTVAASRLPPVNVAMLRALDVNEILRNPQLRHDLLFDALAFRPISSSALGNDGADANADPRNGAGAADMYWESLGDELASGCRCSRWRIRNDETARGKQKEQSCLCEGWKRELTESAWWEWQATRWPSRLPDLIKTLREILISLMGSTTPCPNHFAHSFSREALAAHEATCPTVTHALVPELYAALDPEFLTIQVRRGTFSLAIFQMLGEAMKVHCAPVRDAMVDDMVSTAMSGQVAVALRKCFDCVEIMKLDIANHQVHALRPFLWRAAASHEFAAFKSSLGTSKVSLKTSITQRWIRDASLRVLKSLTPAQRAISVTMRDQMVTRSVVDGFFELVCANWSGLSPEWPPMPARRSTGTVGIHLTEMAPTLPVVVPESFKMDSRRIKNFNAELTELALTHMILVMLRDLMVTTRPKISQLDIARILKEARQDVGHMFDTLDSYRSAQVGEDLSDLAMRLAVRIVKQETSFGARPAVTSAEDLAAIDSTARTIDAFLASNVRADSPVFTSALKDVRLATSTLLTNTLLVQQATSSELEKAAEDWGDVEMEDSVIESPSASIRTAPSVMRARRQAELAKVQAEEEVMLARRGLGVLGKDLRDLSDKMVRIVAFNIKVFEGTYQEKGMMVGV